MRIHNALIVAAFAAVAVSCSSSSDLKTYEATVDYSFTIDDVPPGAEVVTVWAPVPVSDEFQTISQLQISPEPRFVEDSQYGNKLAYFSWNGGATSPVKVSYKIQRKEEVAHDEPTPESLRRRFLEPDRLGIIDETIEKWATERTAGVSTTTEKARALYDFVLTHMSYNKEIPGWGKGDTKRACSTPSGNCSDFHSLFISLARAAKIPARFHYGYALKPSGDIGAHCWAEFLDESSRWVPVDISEADKDPSKTEYFFGRLSENRVTYTMGRDIVLEPRQKGAPLNFLIEPYVEIDGRPHDKVSIEATHRKG